MSDRFNLPPEMRNAFGQVLREIQNGLNKLEQSVGTAAERSNGTSTVDEDVVQDAPRSNAQTERPAAPKPETKPYNGQRWEYKVVYVNFRGQLSSEGEQVMIGRGERRSTFVREYLDQLGNQGWELSGVSPLGETENSYFVFKRPATGEAKPTSNGTSASQKVQVEEVNDGFLV